MMRIGVVAPSGRFSEVAAERVRAIAAISTPQAEIVFHPQCFFTHHHFAGTDEARTNAFVEVANDPDFDAVWFARGGYGACRIAEAAIARLGPEARGKSYLGYSDGGYLLAGLYKAGFAGLAHGPMAQDVLREGGEEAINRALHWLCRSGPEGLEPGLDPTRPNAAFNITVLGTLLGTPLEPDLSGHLLLLEDVSEPMYRIDRAMFHLTSNRNVQSVAGIRLGRCSEIIPNEPDFGESAEQVVRHWCKLHSIAFLGRADIGHDCANHIVPFGRI